MEQFEVSSADETIYLSKGSKKLLRVINMPTYMTRCLVAHLYSSTAKVPFLGGFVRVCLFGFFNRSYWPALIGVAEKRHRRSGTRLEYSLAEQVEANMLPPVFPKRPCSRISHSTV